MLTPNFLLCSWFSSQPLSTHHSAPHSSLVILPLNNNSRGYPCLTQTAQVWWRRQWHPTPVLLPRESHGRRSLVGCSPWGHWELDTTQWLPFHFSLSCIGEGNGSPLQCSCLENPRDSGAWWAAVFGVAQSQTQLKQLSSSSSSARKIYTALSV